MAAQFTDEAHRLCMLHNLMRLQAVLCISLRAVVLCHICLMRGQLFAHTEQLPLCCRSCT